MDEWYRYGCAIWKIGDLTNECASIVKSTIVVHVGIHIRESLTHLELFPFVLINGC